MSFTSLVYIIFVPAALLVYSQVPATARWAVLLAGSYLFYAWLGDPSLLMVLLAVTCLCYSCGVLISRSKNPVTKRFLLLTGITLNVLLLFWMKYLPFLLENLKVALHIMSFNFTAQATAYAAIGVSYYVFQGISYLLDVYFEMLEPERHFGYFALYITFFPKLLQGPIERGGALLPQLRDLAPLRWENLVSGIHLFLWGIFKKVVIADRLATFVDPVYGNVEAHQGISLLVATYLFALQLYFDFSGYTDMALGVARCFNIRLTQNFNAPYLATSMADFWRRWHISFSSWILDYIFKPLQFGFRKWPQWGTPIALILTFLASGLWHGASWNFIVWGAIHGTLLGGSVLMSKSKRRWYKALGIEKSQALAVWQQMVTFHLVCFSWIFFRASSLHDAWYVSLKGITGLSASVLQMATGDGRWWQPLFPTRSSGETGAMLLILLLYAAWAQLSRRLTGAESSPHPLQWLDRTPLWLNGAVYGCLVYLITFCGATTQSFIYLRF